MGARVVREDLAKSFPKAPTQFFVVWAPMLANENHGHAVQQTVKFEDDVRFKFYWDPKKSLPNDLGSQMVLPNGRKQAWDIYLLFDKAAEWGKAAPVPNFWMHQLGRDAKSLDPVRLKRAYEAMIHPKHEFTLLTMPGCARTEAMLVNFQEALRKKGLAEAIRLVNLDDLALDDVRTAYGSPTVLVDGKDVMGLPTPTAPSAAT